MNSRLLATAVRFNSRALHLNLDEITHADSLLQPSTGNCINWIVGHVVRHRNLMLDIVGDAQVWDAAAQRRYDRGSPPVRGAEDGVVELDALVRDFQRSDENLHRALGRSDLLSGRDATGEEKLERLMFLLLHEAYHIGQIAPLRKLAGKQSAIR